MKSLKYQPLTRHLEESGSATVEITFDELGSLVGGLPESATKFGQWWENSGHHSQSRAWLAANYKVESVDRPNRRVKFARR
jgi:hypothetical protein